MSNALTRLQIFFLEQCSEPLSPDAPLKRHLDSVAMLDFVVYIEDEFGITVEDVDVTPKNFSCLETVAAYIAMKAAQ